MGQKSEVRSLPSTIPKEAFEAIVKVLEKDKELISKKKAVDYYTRSSARLRTSTDGSTGAFQESIYRHYLSFEDEATNAAELDQSSLQTFSDEEEGRLSPIGTRSVGDVEKDLALLRMWYKLDMNSIPPVYRLLPIR